MVRNFVHIKSFLHRDSLMYVDVSQNLSLSIFKSKGIKVKYKHAINDTSSRYYLIMCRIHSKDSEKFIDSMKELAANIRACGYSDYEEYCEKAFLLLAA